MQISRLAAISTTTRTLSEQPETRLSARANQRLGLILQGGEG